MLLRAAGGGASDAVAVSTAATVKLADRKAQWCQVRVVFIFIMSIADDDEDDLDSPIKLTVMKRVLVLDDVPVDDLDFSFAFAFG